MIGRMLFGVGYVWSAYTLANSTKKAKTVNSLNAGLVWQKDIVLITEKIRKKS